MYSMMDNGYKKYKMHKLSLTHQYSELEEFKKIISLRK